MPSLEIDLDIYCEACGDDLSRNATVGKNNKITISPCEKCLDAAEDEGLEEGIQQAKSEAEEIIKEFEKAMENIHEQN